MHGGTATQAGAIEGQSQGVLPEGERWPEESQTRLRRLERQTSEGRQGGAGEERCQRSRRSAYSQGRGSTGPSGERWSSQKA
jgi:hypothetical protein